LAVSLRFCIAEANESAIVYRWRSIGGIREGIVNRLSVQFGDSGAPHIDVRFGRVKVKVRKERIQTGPMIYGMQDILQSWYQFT
jgi:hypothetical protein